MRVRARLVLVAALLMWMFVPAVSFGQDTASADNDADAPKRLFGIIPNYRTSPTLADYQPLTAQEKFKVAGDDALDRGTFALAALFAVDAQLTSSAPSFGHGIGAYPHY